MKATSSSFGDLSADEIKTILKPTVFSQIILLESTDSTNHYAKNLARADAPSDTIVIANHQTAGRGRLGRSFFSPSGTGLYMSILLRPDSAPFDASRLTIAAGVAVCRAIKTLCDKKPQIKWVNDIFLDGKKVCGILAEAGTNNDSLEYIIVGIGLNISTEVFPDELSQIAGSLNPSVSRSTIAGEIINEFYSARQLCTSEQLIDEYKDYSLVLGKKISFSKEGKAYTGIASDISIEGNLIVVLENGKAITLKSGEISLGSENFTTPQK